MLAALVLLSLPLHAVDGRQALSWPARCFPAERWNLRIKALGVTGAHATVDIPGGCDAALTHVLARVETTQLISFVWRVKDNLHTTLQPAPLQTVSTVITELENDKPDARTDVYEPTRIITRWTGKNPREVITATPDGAQDPFAVLLALRGAPLLDGDIYRVPVFSKDAVYDGTVTVVGRVNGDALGKTAQLIHLRATFMKDGKVSRVRADIFLTDDALRLPVRVEAGTRFGHLVAVLDSVENVPPAAVTAPP